MSHTPGPWGVIEGPEDRPELTVCYEDRTGQIICVADCLQTTVPPKERKANANLIAAAPELFEALKAIINGDYAGYIPSKLFDPAKQALALAEQP